MRRARTLNIPLNSARERQAARSVSHHWSPCGGRLRPLERGGQTAGHWRSSGTLHLPTLLIDRHAHDLVHGRWRLGVLGRAEAEVIEDLPDGWSWR